MVREEEGLIKGDVQVSTTPIVHIAVVVLSPYHPYTHLHRSTVGM